MVRETIDLPEGVEDVSVKNEGDEIVVEYEEPKEVVLVLRDTLGGEKRIDPNADFDIIRNGEDNQMAKYGNFELASDDRDICHESCRSVGEINSTCYGSDKYEHGWVFDTIEIELV